MNYERDRYSYQRSDSVTHTGNRVKRLCVEGGRMDLESSGTLRQTARPVVIGCWMITMTLTACSFVNSISGGSVSIKPAQDTAWLTGSRRSRSFEIPIVVHNGSSRTVNTDWCVIRAERFTEGAW